MESRSTWHPASSVIALAGLTRATATASLLDHHGCVLALCLAHWTLVACVRRMTNVAHLGLAVTFLRFGPFALVAIPVRH